MVYCEEESVKKDWKYNFTSRGNCTKKDFMTFSSLSVLLFPSHTCTHHHKYKVLYRQHNRFLHKFNFSLKLASL